MTVLTLAKILTGTIVFRLLFLFTGTKAIIGLDALLEVLDEHFVGIDHNAHQNSSNLSL